MSYSNYNSHFARHGRGNFYNNASLPSQAPPPSISQQGTFEVTAYRDTSIRCAEMDMDDCSFRLLEHEIVEHPSVFRESSGTYIRQSFYRFKVEGPSDKHQQLLQCSWAISVWPYAQRD